MIIYIAGMLLISSIAFLSEYMDSRNIICENNYIVGVTGGCMSPFVLYLQVPFILLVFAVYKFTILLSGGEGIRELWVGTPPELAFEIWFFAVPLILLARWLYRRSWK